MNSKSIGCRAWEAEYELSRHARWRMEERGIREGIIETVIRYGRCYFERGAEIYVVGSKEIRRHKKEGIDLSKLNGLHVVCAEDGTVMTAYRNNRLSFKKSRRTGDVLQSPDDAIPARYKKYAHHHPLHFLLGAS